ncbi:hypothetical protein PMAYCL1PPCAC_04255, partial [Pristionchus mayeri]
IKGLRPMHVAFFVTLVVIVVVAVVLAVVLSVTNAPAKPPAITVSLYIGDVDEVKSNARRKRDADGTECLHLEDVKQTVRQTLSILAQDGNVKTVRFITYADTAQTTEEMSLDMGQSQLSQIGMIRNGKAPSQKS